MASLRGVVLVRSGQSALRWWLDKPLQFLPGARPKAPKRNFLLLIGYMLLLLLFYGLFRGI